MEEIIKKVFNEKLENGSLEKIISENIDNMLNDICHDLMSWNGSVKQQMKDKIEPLMSNIIEETDFSKYLIKLTYIINNALKQSNLSEYKTVAESLKGILCHETEKYSYRQEVKISDIFEKYIDFIENAFEESDFNEDDINYDDGTKTAYVECHYFVKEDDDEEYKPNYFSNNKIYHIVFTNEKAEEDEDFAKQTRIEFQLLKTYDDKLEIFIHNDFTISDFRNLPNFILSLLDLNNSRCSILLDKRDIEDTATCEFEY